MDEFLPFFLINAREVSHADFRFTRGMEYRTADFQPGVVRAIRDAGYAKGAEIVPVAEFYAESKTAKKKTKPQIEEPILPEGTDS